MNIKEVRAVMEAALRAEGFEQQRIGPRPLEVWSVPALDIIRCFHASAYRRPWGFIYSGGIGVEVPALREWLNRHKPGEQSGIFHSWFVGYEIANEDVLGEFMVNHGEPVPADLWAGLLMDRILNVPTSLDALVAAYRSQREQLGWLAHPHQKPAWDFLLKWREHPDPALHVPRMLPDGRIV
jgi:hypothetical protein